MIQGLKESVPIVVKASLQVTLTGQWLADEVFDCITSLGQVGFKVKGIVVDNHSTNVSAFNILQTRFLSGCFDIQHSHNSIKTYLFFDNVHLVKNIRNNLLNCKKFVFSGFSFSLNDQLLHAKSYRPISLLVSPTRFLRGLSTPALNR